METILKTVINSPAIVQTLSKPILAMPTDQRIPVYAWHPAPTDTAFM